jgi:enoyl-CoA hydratase/carnithine racemase
MAIASEKAKLGQPEIVLGGLAPAAAAIFPRIMPEKKGFELILLGENASAAEAERIGLVNKVVAEEELDNAAEELAKKFLAKSSLSIRLCREAFYKCADITDFDEAVKYGTEAGIKTWETEDGQEGLKSYLEKRNPLWKNR